MSGTLKVGGKTIATHDTNTNVAKIQLGSTSDVVLTDSAGNNVLSESGSVVTLTADEANVGSNALIVDSSGNVGIGTSSPTGELHIKNSNPAFRIEGTSSGNMQFGQWDGSNNRIQSSSRPFQLITTDSQPITLYTNNTERMRIDSSGNFIISHGSTGSTYKAVRFQYGGSDAGGNAEIRGYGGVSTAGFLNFVTGNTERILIDPNGDVKINALNASADVVTDGSGYLTTSSDARLKNEIGLITESGIEVIKQIIPKYFSWKEDENNKQHLGFFAQDIHPVLPEAAPRALKYTEVGRDENDEPILEQVLDENGDPDYQWGLATQPIVAMLVKAIQEQQTLIESQQSQIDALTARIEALETPA